MAKQVKYAVRGRMGGVRYKVVNGVIKRFGEARGEDTHESKFTAIYKGGLAFRAWRMRPQGLVLDVCEIEVIQ